MSVIEKPIAADYSVIEAWNEDRDGSMPDDYWTTCPRCGVTHAEWHGTNYVLCDCGCIFDPSTETEVEMEMS